MPNLESSMPNFNPNSTLEAYVQDGLNEVEGWCGSVESVLHLGHLASLQEDCDEYGAFEIGVHRGRYLIALHAMCAPGTRSLGLDLFEGDQEKNVDQSGHGDATITRGNIDNFAREPNLIDLRYGDSLAITDPEIQAIKEEFGGFRISSVDGGHTPIHVFRDTMTAAALSAPGGLISIDDFFHTNFPGVTEGIYRLLDSKAQPFVPLMVNRKKLILCHLSYLQTYRTQLDEGRREGAFSGIGCKRVQIAGYDVLSFYH